MGARRCDQRGSPLLIWIEVVLGFAVPIAWGVWQLWDLRRERQRDAAKREQAARVDRA